MGCRNSPGQQGLGVQAWTSRWRRSPLAQPSRPWHMRWRRWAPSPHDTEQAPHGDQAPHTAGLRAPHSPQGGLGPSGQGASPWGLKGVEALRGGEHRVGQALGGVSWGKDLMGDQGPLGGLGRSLRGFQAGGGSGRV